MAKKRGRPPGSKNRKFDNVNVAESRCKACNSIERTAYEANPETIHFSKVYKSPLDDQPYNAVVRRKCQCTKCGRWRRDSNYILVDKATVNKTVAEKPDKMSRPRTARSNRV